MDKYLTKVVLAANGIRTAKWLNVKSVEEIDYDAIEKMGYPVFIKPTNGGSSVATFKVYDKEKVQEAVPGQAAAAYHAPCVPPYFLYEYGKCRYGY